MWSYALNALYPYDEFNWMKYFYTISTLDKFNWGPCMKIKGLDTLIEKNNKWWDDFWSKPDAKETMEKNISENQEEVGIAVISLQQSWNYGDFENAGTAYASFWGLLMGKPVLEGVQIKDKVGSAHEGDCDISED